MTLPAPPPPPPPPEPLVWRVLAPDALCWAHWPTASSLFNADTGESHLLDALPAEALRLLCRRPWSAAALGRHLALLCDTADDGPWQAQLARVLAELADLELIEAVPAGPAGPPADPAPTALQAVG